MGSIIFPYYNPTNHGELITVHHRWFPGLFRDASFFGIVEVSTVQEFMELFLSEIVLLLGLVVAHYKQFLGETF